MLVRVGASEFENYVVNFMTPIVEASRDDGQLATFLNWQLDEWEMQVARCDAPAMAPLVVDHLKQLLVDLRARIVERIAAAEAVLQGWAA